MDVVASLRQDAGGSWTASNASSGDVGAGGGDNGAVTASGPDRDTCLANLRRALAARLPEGEPLILIVEAVPELAGVAEASAVMGWDKRRVITYINRGSFPPPVQALASGRVWVRSDVEAFAEAWRARRLERRRPGPPSER